MSPKQKFWLEILASGTHKVFRNSDGRYAVEPPILRTLDDAIVRNLERCRYIAWQGDVMMIADRGLHDIGHRGKGAPKGVTQ